MTEISDMMFINDISKGYFLRRVSIYDVYVNAAYSFFLMLFYVKSDIRIRQYFYVYEQDILRRAFHVERFT